MLVIECCASCHFTVQHVLAKASYALVGLTMIPKLHSHSTLVWLSPFWLVQVASAVLLSILQWWKSLHSQFIECFISFFFLFLSFSVFLIELISTVATHTIHYKLCYVNKETCESRPTTEQERLNLTPLLITAPSYSTATLRFIVTIFRAVFTARVNCLGT